MAETFTGKLSFDKGRWKIVFFDEKKQKESTLFCQTNVFAVDFAPKEDDETEAHFERDTTPQQNAIRVRAKDAEWKEPAPKIQAAPARTAANLAPQNQEDYRRRDNPPRRYDNQARRDDMANQTQPREREFHNPYNFVPAIPRDHVDGKTNELGDREPSGHDRFLADKYSGKLRVRMTVATPLLLPDTARVELNNKHKIFDVRVDEKGEPVINPTAIKGILRSAYEAITNSRLSVFQKHDERLAFRMESTEGARSVPARVKKDKTDGKLYVVLYTGTSELGADGRPLNEDSSLTDEERERNAILCAAWLPMYETRTFWTSRDAEKPRDAATRFPQHGEELFAWIERIQHINKKTNNPDFQYWRVRCLAIKEDSLGEEPEPSGDTPYHKSLKEFIPVKGYVCNTGQNIKNKHDERFFFIYGRNEAEIIKVEFDPSKHGKAWETLIKNYRQEHSEKNGGWTEPPEAENNGQKLEWSRHIQRTKFAEVSKDDELKAESIQNSPLCYARVLKNTSGEFDVIELYPVTISRRIHQVPPSDLLPSELHPAYKTKELSPADRVFGWVRQTGREKHEALSPEEKRLSAYRGQLRIGSVRLSKNDSTGNGIDDFNGQTVPVQILGQPKPQQGRFYVAKDKDGNAQPKVDDRTEKGLTNEQAGYRDKTVKGLRGRKVYPHHNFPDEIKKEYWRNPAQQWEKPLLKKYYQEFRRPDGVKQRDKQNRSIKGWILPETEFNFDINFINLSKVELGALIWLLALPAKHFHRFGGGKPLGFGSVRLDLEEAQSEILCGEKIKERYATLEDVPLSNSITAKDCKDEFEKAVREVYQDGNFLEAFKQAARGFDKGFPIHYPRKSKEPKTEGNNFEWFMLNSKTQVEREGGRVVKNNFGEDVVKVNNGYALPNLTDEIGLPLVNDEPRRDGGSRGRRR